ncbi:unnamed protein product [Ceutorhynchus assimilis]|uniref:Pectinesterase n=1 Tax=Ceutorhynchus assimilis TaxID=467358 RepID=A0A9N9MIM8_9CUCU|nr:unnamed protein product [Ceutorhynchus assimilis]
MFFQLLVIIHLLLTTLASHQTYPGTNTRPILSDTEAVQYTKAKYLQGWAPSDIATNKADYTVGSGGYTNIQAAVNAAIKAGGTTRKYIKILPGKYAQLVFIPQTTVPLTLYGSVGHPALVHIILSQGAKMSGAEWSKQVNPNGSFYREGDPAWPMYHDCAIRATIGTFCSSVVWAQNDNLEFAYVTIENPSIVGQAVAVSKSTIKGDVDFIFGPASAVFENTNIIARADRPRNTAVIFAPNTTNTQKFGFLLIRGNITAETAIKNNRGVHLVRAWDSTPSANGQILIRDSIIDAVINVNAPYDKATSGRSFSGNINKNRNLNDSKYNRFWEYANIGSGA